MRVERDMEKSRTDELVAAFLRANDRDAYCPACLALGVAVSSRDAEEAMTRLGREPEFIIERGRCAQCSKTDNVLRFLHRARLV